MSKWQLQITRMDNGWLLENTSDELAEDCLHRAVIDENKGDLAACREMLYEVKNFFAFFHSKHNRQNIVIALEEDD